MRITRCISPGWNNKKKRVKIFVRINPKTECDGTYFDICIICINLASFRANRVFERCFIAKQPSVLNRVILSKKNRRIRRDVRTARWKYSANMTKNKNKTRRDWLFKFKFSPFAPRIRCRPTVERITTRIERHWRLSDSRLIRVWKRRTGKETWRARLGALRRGSYKVNTFKTFVMKPYWFHNTDKFVPTHIHVLLALYLSVSAVTVNKYSQKNQLLSPFRVAVFIFVSTINFHIT